MNRHSEACKMFSRVNWEAESSLGALDDYFVAYMQFLSGHLQEAKNLAAKYQNSPVLRVQKRYATLVQHIEEATNQKQIVGAETKSDSKMEPSLSFTVADKALVIEYQNVKQVNVSYYMMDIEFLFSSNPFMSKQNSDMGQFAYVKPTQVDTLELPQDLMSYRTNLPEKFHNSNVMVELAGNEIHHSCPYFAHSMQVHIDRAKGLLQVTSPENKPLASVYVKVYYAASSGLGLFYKDGYTDYRGVFDYLFLTCDSKLAKAKKFAILLTSPEHGSVIHEVRPPK